MKNFCKIIAVFVACGDEAEVELLKRWISRDEGHYWTQAEAERECEGLAEQLSVKVSISL